jgi:DNA invertase Pin-like site-specific DNA recombinase
MFQMMGVFAEFERSMIKERVRAGLRRAKDEGKQLGRPRIPAVLERRILAVLKTPGRTDVVRKIAKRFGVDPSTVQRISCPLAGEGPREAMTRRSSKPFKRDHTAAKQAMLSS